MELIQNQKVRDEALRHSVNDIVKYNSFYTGANFVLKEIEPLFCEFAEWCSFNDYKLVEMVNKIGMWSKSDNYDKAYSTKQLFDLWLEERNKKKEPE